MVDSHTRKGRPQAIILAGGKGQRFWPLSRTDRPKQLLNIFGGITLLKASFERLKFVFGPENIWIITLARYADAVRVQLPELSPDQILIEPFGRNTAPSIGLGAHAIEQKHGPCTVGVFPCDHIITGREKFTLAVEASLKLLETADFIVTLGVKPTSPETGYGYIKRGREVADVSGTLFYRSEAFIEKPDRARALKYSGSKKYFWNAGIFIFRTDGLLRVFAHHLPRVHRLLTGLPCPLNPEDVKEVYDKVPSISIDYAVMEKAKKIAVCPGDFVWSDVGSWSALESFFEKDGDGVAARGRAVQFNSRNCFVYNPSRLVALVGVEDLHVVETDDVILVCRKEHDQNVKHVVDLLNERGWKEYI